jgi:hypothetical protein
MNYTDITKELASKEPVELELREPSVAYAAGARVGGNDWGPGVGKGCQAAERKESAAAYDLDDDDDLDLAALGLDDDVPEGEALIDVIDQILSDPPDPKYAEARAELERMFDESEAAKAAGLVYTSEEVLNDITRRIRTGQWDD